MGLFTRLKTYANGGKLFPSDLNTLQDGIAAAVNHIDSTNVDDGTIANADLAGSIADNKLAAACRATALPTNASMAVATFDLTWGAREDVALGSPNFDVLSFVNGTGQQGFAPGRAGVWAVDVQLYFQHADSTRKLRMLNDANSAEWAHSVRGDHGPGDGSYLHLAFCGYISGSDGPFYFELANGFASENFSVDGSGGRRSRIRCSYVNA